MTEEELKDLSRYFKLSNYRDGEYFLLEEYEELEIILKKNHIAREIEAARTKSILGKISEEEYQELYDRYFNLTINKQKIKD